MSEIDLAAIERGKEEAAKRDGLRKGGVRDRVSGTKPEEGIPLDPAKGKASKALVKRPETPKPAARVSPEPLTPAEARRLQELEEVIATNAAAFVGLAAAMTEIRDQRLYRETHETFEDYCRERWDYSKTHVNRLIAGRQVHLIVGDTPWVPNERVARELAVLLDQPKVLKKVATRLAAAPQVTAKVAREIVQDIAPEAKPKPSEPESTDAQWRQVVIEGLRSARLGLTKLQRRKYKVVKGLAAVKTALANIPNVRKQKE